MNVVLSPAERKDYKAVKALMLSAFPPEERPPFFFVRRKAEQGKAALLTARDGGGFVGFAYVLEHKDLAYLFFLAISEERRGGGYGSAVLEKLKERYAGKRLFLAREQLDETAENYDQRVRRHRFYLRNGFEDLPCRIKEASVVYDAMGVGGPFTPGEYQELITAWCGNWYRKLLDLRAMDAPPEK